MRVITMLAFGWLALLFSISEVSGQTATVTAATNQSCAGTRFGADLLCTANDFSSTLTFDQPSATAISSCRYGQMVDISVIGTVTSNSPERYDAAYFLSENGLSPELNNPSATCSIGMFPTSPLPFQNVDGDACGDYQSGGVSTLMIQNARVMCKAKPGTNSLALPYVLVFNNSNNGNSCTLANVTASTKSKCLVNVTATVTGVTINGYVTLTKQTLPDTQPQAFSFTTSSSPAGTVTPSAFTLSDNLSQTVEVPLITGGTRTLTITETSTSGWSDTSAITCTTPSGASASSYVTVNNATRTITATLNDVNYGANCTITNTKIPTVKVQKITNGQTGGPFTFAQTNLASAPGGITTTLVGTAQPASPAAVQVVAAGTAVTLTETVASGYVLGSASCTDDNSARTGNTGTIGSLSGNTLTIPAANVTAGSDYTCVFTNNTLPRLQINAISNGGTGAFDYSGGNGYALQTVTTVTSGIVATSSPHILTAANTSTAITATIPTGYLLAGAACTGLGPGGTATLSGNILTINAAAVALSTNSVCTFTYTKRPVVRLQKSTSTIAGGPFSFSATNLDSSFANITTSAVDSATPTNPTAHYVTALGSTVTITEASPAAMNYALNSVACTDANASVTGNSGNLGTLADLTITLPPTTIVAGADITCVFNNRSTLISLTVTKSANVSTVASAGSPVVFTIIVQNTGLVTLTSFTVIDTLGAVICATSGNATIASLAAGVSETCTMTYLAQQTDFDSAGGGDNDIDNLATANGFYSTTPVAASGSTAVGLTIAPSLTVDKTQNAPGPVIAGQTVTYSFRVRNTGNTTINAVSIADISNGFGSMPQPTNEMLTLDVAPLNDSYDAGNEGLWDVLAPGDEILFTASYVVVQSDIDYRQ